MARSASSTARSTKRATGAAAASAIPRRCRPTESSRFYGAPADGRDDSRAQDARAPPRPARQAVARPTSNARRPPGGRRLRPRVGVRDRRRRTRWPVPHSPGPRGDPDLPRAGPRGRRAADPRHPAGPLDLLDELRRLRDVGRSQPDVDIAPRPGVERRPPRDPGRTAGHGQGRKVNRVAASSRGSSMRTTCRRSCCSSTSSGRAASTGASAIEDDAGACRRCSTSTASAPRRQGRRLRGPLGAQASSTASRSSTGATRR